MEGDLMENCGLYCLTNKEKYFEVNGSPKFKYA